MILQCGGGISHQLRRCLDVRCVGPSHRERVCATEPCEKGAIYPRETQCSKLDGYVLINGERRAERWFPVRGNQQCLVTCSSLETGRERVLRKLNDGTSCIKEGYNISVCLNGTCQHVGCDGIIGSSARFDHCGICGGDGIIYVPSTEQEKFVMISKHSGFRVSVSVCQNVRTGRVVPERLCADQPRPRPMVERCAHIICPSQ
ncbi:unnamed protein product [Anisakis simplex]|uniref:ADAMTS_CR_3 domain-containing protein n=1 Tax=Anisakis simplex TaxID=6269 RepID=A0A0M3JZX9_ANISI|nr:unnamed protein product [Anisakis simplex]